MTTSPVSDSTELPSVWPADSSAMDVAVVEGWASIPELPWLERAACRDLALDELDLFFVDAGRTISADTVAMCRSCPVRLDCLDHAYRNEISSGFFGGMSPSRRRQLSHEDARAELSAGSPTAGRD